MQLFTEEIKNQLKTILDVMKQDVTIEIFVKEGQAASQETLAFMEEFTAISDKLTLVTRDLDRDAEAAAKYRIDRAPTFVVLNRNGEDRGMRFSGMPAGYEINSFLSAVLEQSGVEDEVPEDLKQRILAVDRPVNIKVFVTQSCPHCPQAVQKAHKLAMLNSNVTAEMIEAGSFAELSDQYNVSSVPQIVYNDKDTFLGNQPFNVFVEALEGAAAEA